MGRKSLAKQIEETLQGKLCIGESKHQAKLDGVADQGIYSWETFRSYMKHANYFADWCKEQHGCRTLSSCREYVDEFLTVRGMNLSPYTVKLEAAALAKLYGCSATDFVETAPRHRSDVTRSRGEKVRDKNFSEGRNLDFVDFCRGTGGRRSELAALTGDKLVYRDGQPCILFDSATKGGRVRVSPIIGNVEKIVSMMEAAGSGKVFEKIPNGADIHGYRSDYATAIYKANARSLEECKRTPFWNSEHSNGKGRPKGGLDRDSVYWMRGDRKGDWLDKNAMKIASEALGHSRISVVGESYIRG